MGLLSFPGGVEQRAEQLERIIPVDITIWRATWAPAGVSVNVSRPSASKPTVSRPAASSSAT
jgi:hypothetical protein